MSERLCTICLNSVGDDNSRGKAELVCGHLFHLDCIGSEFNYRSEMKCPNCRVVENGQWLIPDEEVDDDDDVDYSMHVRRLELHIYSHNGRDSSTSRGQTGGQEPRSPTVNPTVHYHHNTIVLPSNHGGNAPTVFSDDPLSAEALLRTYGTAPQSSTASRPTRPDRVGSYDPTVPRPPNIPNEPRPQVYTRTRFRNNPAAPTATDAESMRRRQGENTPVQANTVGNEPPLSSREPPDDPSLELTLNTSTSTSTSTSTGTSTNANANAIPSEDRSQEEQHGTSGGGEAHETNLGFRY